MDAERYYEFSPEPDTREEHALSVKDWLYELLDRYAENRSRNFSLADPAIEWIETWLLPLPDRGRWAMMR